MGLKKEYTPQKMPRFKEFDEARKPLETPKEFSYQEIYEAIDYMLVHKEFYYLLKTLLRHKDHKLIEYLFLRLECLKREEDQQMIQNYLLDQDPFIRQKAYEYILSCCQNFDIPFLLSQIPLTFEMMERLLEFGECEKVKEFMLWQQKECEQKLLLFAKFFSLFPMKDQ